MSNPKAKYCDNCASSTHERTDKYLTKAKELGEQLEALQPYAVTDADWQKVLSMMPMDLEATAEATKAIQRRREVRRAEDLLRIALIYALCDWSLLLTAAWACLMGWANLSGIALRKRLKGAKTFMGALLAAWVIRNRGELADYPVRLRLVDATAVSGLHSKGTDWRIHLSFDLGQGGFDGVEVTDSHGGETLVRHPAQPGDILVADRGYAHRRGIGKVLSQSGALVVRISLQNVPMNDEAGEKFNPLPWLRQAPAGEPIEHKVQIETPDGTFSVRLIARRLNEQAAEAARRRLRQQARKKGRTPDQRSLEAAGFITVLSNLAPQEWSAGQVLAAYRLRWQVELAFKRLKGVLTLDHLRAQDPDLCQTYLLAKLLGAMMVDRLSRAGSAPSIDWFESVERPVSPWRWLVLWSDALRRAVQGLLSLSQLLSAVDRLGRYLCDTPRRRRQHYALGRHLMKMLTDLARAPADETVHAKQLAPVFMALS